MSDPAAEHPPWTPDPTHPASVRSRLLLGGPHLVDPNFFRTTVAVLQHNAEGAFGLVLNRPLSDVVTADVVPAWADHADPVIFGGGPVSPESGFGLAVVRPGVERPDGLRPLLGDLCLLDLDADPATVGPALARLRIFSGYSGWSPGQLDNELEMLGWLVVDAGLSDVFTDDPSEAWSAALLRQRGPLRRLAHYPIDPGLN